jgi:hypothetical protein
MQMTDEDVVRRFHATVGMGNVTTWQPPGTRKRTWSWKLTSFEKVQAAIAMFWPWLGQRRRARAVEVLLERRSAGVPQRHRVNCPRGHPYDYVVPSRGTRACRRCMATSNKKCRSRPGAREQMNRYKLAWRQRQKEVS